MILAIIPPARYDINLIVFNQFDHQRDIFGIIL